MAPAKQWNDRIGRRLKLHDMHVFVTVTERGSMGKAAKELAVSQPAVSKAIAELEHTVGVRLLDRTASGVEPTLYGRALLKWGRVLFDDLRQGVKEIEFLADPTVGELRIGSTEPMTAGLVPAVIDRLSRQYPRLVITVLQAPTVVLQYCDLRDRNVDLILGRMITPVPERDLNLEILFDDPFRVVAGTNNRWARRRRIEIAELIDEPWTLPTWEGWAGARVLEAFRAVGLDAPRRVMFSNSIQLHNAMLATGRFLTVLSASTVRFSGKRLALKALPVNLQIPAGAVGIITLKDRTPNPVASLFIECAREVAKPLAQRK